MNTAWSKPTKYIVGVSLAFLGISVMYLSRPVIPLLIVSALIAVIVRPVILWLHLRVRLPRGLSVTVVYLGLLILAPLVVLLAIPTIVDALDYIIRLDYQSILQDVMEINNVTYLTLIFSLIAREMLRLMQLYVVMFLRYGFSITIMSHSDDDFSSGVSLPKIPESFRSLT